MDTSKKRPQTDDDPAAATPARKKLRKAAHEQVSEEQEGVQDPAAGLFSSDEDEPLDVDVPVVTDDATDPAPGSRPGRAVVFEDSDDV